MQFRRTGLFLLREFIKAMGSLRILANNGYYEQHGRDQNSQTLQAAYPGTLIQVTLLIREDEVYTIRGT